MSLFIPSIGAAGFSVVNWYVDGNTTLPTGRQNGSLLSPYKTITQGLEGLIDRSVSAVLRRAVDRINVANTPFYNETLNIDLTARNLEIIGKWSLGVFDQFRWAPQTGIGNINITGDLEDPSGEGIRSSLIIASDTFNEDLSDFNVSNYHGPRIGGKINIDMTNTGGSNSWLLGLQGRFFGTTGDSSGVTIEDVNLTDGSQALNLQMSRARFDGKVILGNNGRFEDIILSRCQADIRCGFFGRAENSAFRGNWDLQNPTSGIGDPVNGFYDCEFPTSAWTWAGPADFFVDATSNFFSKQGPLSLISNAAGGPGAKIIQSDLTP